MSEIKPNHICKNINCHKGSDGGRKHYYACDYCTHIISWHSIACCFECYEEYTNQVVEARSKGNNIVIIPERTDMTEQEVKKLIDEPDDVVITKTKEQLKDYRDEDGSINFGEAVDRINNKLNINSKTTRSRKKKIATNA